MDAVDDGLFDDLCFLVVVEVVVLVVLSGLVVDFGAKVACDGPRRCVERWSARRRRVAVGFAHVDWFLALWAGVQDVVLGDALHF